MTATVRKAVIVLLANLSRDLANNETDAGIEVTLDHEADMVNEAIRLAARPATQ